MIFILVQKYFDFRILFFLKHFLLDYCINNVLQDLGA